MEAATKQALRIVEGATATCVYCGDLIALDVTMGGGDAATFGAWDWGTLDSYGMDFGCGDSPDTDADATGGHSPIWETISAS